MKRSIFVLATSVAFATLAPGASGRATFLDLDVQTAVAAGLGRERLLGIPFYMKGQAHPAITEALGQFRSNKRTNAFNKSDETACQIAFLSAVITFQERARSMGGDAIVDLTSITKGNELESATHYRCVAGNVVANVALSGLVVRLRK